MSLLSDRRFILLLRVALGAIWIAAALPKLADPVGFATSIDHYRMVPDVVARVMALVLPPLELLIGIGLILGVIDAGASLVGLALLLVFDAAIVSALARGLDISCGCFDTEGGTQVGWGKLGENALLTLASWRVWTGDRSALSLRAMMTRAADVD